MTTTVKLYFLRTHFTEESLDKCLSLSNDNFERAWILSQNTMRTSVVKNYEMSIVH